MSWVWSVQVGSGRVRYIWVGLVQLSSVQLGSDQFGSGQVGLVHVSMVQLTSVRVGSFWFQWGQVSSVRVRSGQFRMAWDGGQVGLIQFSSGWVGLV